MGELRSPDGRLAARWYTWGSSGGPYEHETRWRVELLNARTGLVLRRLMFSHWANDGGEGGANVSGCEFSPDSRRLEIRLDDGSAETIELASLDIDPRHDEGTNYVLKWEPLSGTGCEIQIRDRVYGQLHRTLRVEPDPERAPIRRVAFSEHPGVISIVRKDGSIDTRFYDRRSWPDELKTLSKDPAGRLAVSRLNHTLAPQGDAGATVGSLGVWDAWSGRQLACRIGPPFEDVEFTGPFRVRLGCEEVSILDHLLPFGALQVSRDRRQVLRFFTSLHEPTRDSTVRWSLVELIDAERGDVLKRAVVFAPFVKREDETVTISDFLTPPTDPPPIESPSELVSVAFGDRGKIRCRLLDGSETEIRFSSEPEGAPPEARRGRTAALVLAVLGLLGLIIHLTIPDNDKDLAARVAAIATLAGPPLAFFGLLISAISSLRAGKAAGLSPSYAAGAAANVALLILWLWRWSTILG